MKVLFISNIPSPYRVDFFQQLGKYVELTVIFEAKRADGIRFDWKETCQGFRAVFLSDGNIKERSVNFKILRYIKKGAYDYIFVTNYACWTETAAYLKLVLCKIPFVLETDGGMIRHESRIRYRLKSYLLSKPYAYFSPADTADRYFMRYGAKKREIVRYHFTSLWKKDILKRPVSVREKKMLRKKLCLEQKPVILFIGQLIHRKGVDVLLKALKGITMPYQCLLVGAGPDAVYLERLRQMADENVRFASFKTKDELKLYYQCATVFVLPARYDVWGLVVNEALALGLPVITTDGCVAGKELIQNNKNGLLVRKNDAAALREAVICFLKQEDDPQAAQRCLDSIRDYTIEQMAAEHVDFMEANAGYFADKSFCGSGDENG